MEYPPSYFLRAPIRISKYLSHSTGPRPFTFSPTVVSVSAACWGKAEFDISSRDVTPEHWPITLTFVPGSPGNPGSPCGPVKPGSPFKNTIREECWITYKAVCNYNNTSLFWVVFPPVLLTDLWLWCNSYFSSWVLSSPLIPAASHHAAHEMQMKQKVSNMGFMRLRTVNMQPGL